MAGLCAAARARELGARPIVLEKGSRPGGSMLLSSCVVWRYRTFEDFRAECPGGDEALQRAVFDGFDEALEWLVSLGPEVVWEDTPNPRTTGKRFAPRSLTEALVRAAGEVRIGHGLGTVPGTWAEEPLVLATGGFAVRYARERGLLVRCNPWSEGDGLDFAQARGAELAGDLHEFYGRAMPAVERLAEKDFVRLTQLYGRYATVTSHDMSEQFEGEPRWSEIDIVQQIARWPDALAWYTVDRSALGVQVGGRTIREMVEAARAAGAPVEAEDGRIAVLVRPGVTHTLGGLRIDARAHVVGTKNLYAAGADVGGISTGGYSSGLAAALVLGRIAAETAA
jgi:succinate dehydrogenase/fumarate reductase flavoprotein subunit